MAVATPTSEGGRWAGKHLVQGCLRSLGLELCVDQQPGDSDEMLIWMQCVCYVGRGRGGQGSVTMASPR